jgi:hypothetical protein
MDKHRVVVSSPVPETLIKMWVARVAQKYGIYATKPLKDM